MQRQSEEIARLRGQIETLTYELETAKKRQQDFYLDLDTRLRKLEPQGGGPAAVDGEKMGEFQGDSGGKPPPTRREGKDYEAALNQFKVAKYKEAAWHSRLRTEIPGQFAGAQRPVLAGQRLVAQRNCAKAIEAHSVVTTKYADSPKAADSWLAMANCQQEMGNATAARRSLKPSSPGSQFAGRRYRLANA